MSALFCLFLCSRSYSEKLEVYILKFYKIRYILHELYVVVIWTISQLIICIDQLNTVHTTLYISMYSYMYTNMYISWWVYFVTGLSYVLQQPLTARLAKTKTDTIHTSQTLATTFVMISSGNETSRNESSFSRYLPLFWPVRQSGDAVERNLSLSQNTPITWYTYLAYIQLFG